MGRSMALQVRCLSVMFLVVAGSGCESDQATKCVPGQTCRNQVANPIVGGSGAAGIGTGAPSGPIAGSSLAGSGGVGGAGSGGGGTTPIGGAAAAGTGGVMAIAGSGGGSGGGAGGTTMAGTGGTMAIAGSGGSSGGGAGGTTMAGTGGTAASGDEFEAARQLCVDTINMYRATKGLMPLVRATPEQEICSDNGAKLDGDSGSAHGSAGMCQLGSQNACPGYPLRIGGGTVEGTLKYCLMQMWDEGEPPNGVDACKADRSGCYLQYGHWINMVEPNIRVVGCGFYKMANGNYWMNQNFGR